MAEYDISYYLIPGDNGEMQIYEDAYKACKDAGLTDDSVKYKIIPSNAHLILLLDYFESNIEEWKNEKKHNPFKKINYDKFRNDQKKDYLLEYIKLLAIVAGVDVTQNNILSVESRVINELRKVLAKTIGNQELKVSQGFIREAYKIYRDDSKHKQFQKIYNSKCYSDDHKDLIQKMKDSYGEGKLIPSAFFKNLDKNDREHLLTIAELNDYRVINTDEDIFEYECGMCHKRFCGNWGTCPAHGTKYRLISDALNGKFIGIDKEKLRSINEDLSDGDDEIDFGELDNDGLKTIVQKNLENFHKWYTEDDSEQSEEENEEYEGNKEEDTSQKPSSENEDGEDNEEDESEEHGFGTNTQSDPIIPKFELNPNPRGDEFEKLQYYTRKEEEYLKLDTKAKAVYQEYRKKIEEYINQITNGLILELEAKIDSLGTRSPDEQKQLEIEIRKTAEKYSNNRHTLAKLPNIDERIQESVRLSPLERVQKDILRFTKLAENVKQLDIYPDYLSINENINELSTDDIECLKEKGYLEKYREYEYPMSLIRRYKGEESFKKETKSISDLKINMEFFEYLFRDVDEETLEKIGIKTDYDNLNKEKITKILQDYENLLKTGNSDVKDAIRVDIDTIGPKIASLIKGVLTLKFNSVLKRLDVDDTQTSGNTSEFLACLDSFNPNELNEELLTLQKYLRGLWAGFDETKKLALESSHSVKETWASKDEKILTIIREEIAALSKDSETYMDSDKLKQAHDKLLLIRDVFHNLNLEGQNALADDGTLLLIRGKLRIIEDYRYGEILKSYSEEIANIDVESEHAIEDLRCVKSRLSNENPKVRQALSERGIINIFQSKVRSIEEANAQKETYPFTENLKKILEGGVKTDSDDSTCIELIKRLEFLDPNTKSQIDYDNTITTLRREHSRHVAWRKCEAVERQLAESLEPSESSIENIIVMRGKIESLDDSIIPSEKIESLKKMNEERLEYHNKFDFFFKRYSDLQNKTDYEAFNQAKILVADYEVLDRESKKSIDESDISLGELIMRLPTKILDAITRKDLEPLEKEGLEILSRSDISDCSRLKEIVDAMQLRTDETENEVLKKMLHAKTKYDEVVSWEREARFALDLENFTDSYSRHVEELVNTYNSSLTNDNLQELYVKLKNILDEIYLGERTEIDEFRAVIGKLDDTAAFGRLRSLEHRFALFKQRASDCHSKEIADLEKHLKSLKARQIELLLTSIKNDISRIYKTNSCEDLQNLDNKLEILSPEQREYMEQSGIMSQLETAKHKIYHRAAINLEKEMSGLKPSDPKYTAIKAELDKIPEKYKGGLFG